ncbi:hypothetical protein H5410_041502 [Solanum commersonii]|uniref:Uncharacterized protein n=1 Tax=Solanum commersonii TaxID=4109 RepID=A0A9J5XUR1_SOLCO|nr:hypothetical protein H5410_041502 [Solanum commersonii]
MINSNYKGKEKVAHSSIQPPLEIEDFKLKDYLDLENFLENKFKGDSVISKLPPPEIEDFKLKDYSDLENFFSKKFKGGSLKPIKVDNFSEGEAFNLVCTLADLELDSRVKENIKTLDTDDNIKESLCKIMLNSDSGKIETDYSSHEESSTSEDLKALHQEDYLTSDDDCLLANKD